MSPDNLSASHTNRVKKIFKRILIILLGLLLILLISFLLFSPVLVRNYLNKHGEELTGRKIRIEKIKINYFTTTLQVMGARMYEQLHRFCGF